MKKHELLFERLGRAVGWDGDADIYICRSCRTRFEAKPRALPPKPEHPCP